METLYNHLTICSHVYHGNQKEAIQCMIDNLQNLQSTLASPLLSEIVHQYRIYLSSLNYSIYNYILYKEQVSLHQCCGKNNSSLHCCTNNEDAIVLGTQIIRSYCFCSDYLVEKHTNPLIKKSLYYIHENLSTGITLAMVAEHVNLNAHYFCMLFKKQTSYSFNDYINRKRIQLAKQLMDSSTLSLDVISCQCGFNSYSYFCTTFKRLVKVSPSQYRCKK